MHRCIRKEWSPIFLAGGMVVTVLDKVGWVPGCKRSFIRANL
jgi:hypothetical protein